MLEERLSPNDLSSLSNEEFESVLCAQLDEVVRDCGVDIVREFLEPDPRGARAFERWLALRAGELDDDDEIRLPVTELERLERQLQ